MSTSRRRPTRGRCSPACMRTSTYLAPLIISPTSLSTRSPLSMTTTYARTALVLPLPTLAHIRDPTPYSHPIRIATWQTTSHLTIIFTRSASLFSDSGILGGEKRLGAWETVQRFLGCVYGFASQECMRVGRLAMGVDVVVEGWRGSVGEGWVEGEWDRVMGRGECALFLSRVGCSV